MQNEHHFPSGTEGKVECQRPEEEKWAEFVRNLEMLGAQLSELSSHPAVLGDHFIQRLNTQYQTVCNRADVWKQTTDQQIDAIRKLADYQGREAQGTFRDIRARSKATAFEMWERSEPLRQGAQDVGEGLVRALGRIARILWQSRESTFVLGGRHVAAVHRRASTGVA